MDRPPAGSRCGTNRECQSHHRDYQHNLLAEREREREKNREGVKLMDFPFNL